MKLLIENNYDDGHECSAEVEFNEYEPDPEDEEEMESFWQDDIFFLTGCHCTPDGHPFGNSYYTATIIEAVNKALLDKSEEWD